MKRTAISVFILCFCLVLAAQAYGITDEEVNASIEKGIAWLRKQQKADGSFEAWTNYKVGPTALAAYALLSCEVPADDPVIKKAIAFCNSHPTDTTYELAVYIMMLQAADAAKYYANIAAAAEKLVASQKASGAWDYKAGAGSRFDNSNTQYAMLGLNAARLADFPINKQVFSRAQSHYYRTQKSSGGWGYQTPARVTGSMTTGALSSLLIAGEVLDVATQPCGTVRVNARLERGMRYLQKSFSVSRNPGAPGHYYYYMYGLERVGVLSGRKFIGRHDWYREGAGRLLELQDSAGFWSGAKPVEHIVHTSFALLFLAKGRAPAVMTKLMWNGDWNNYIHDVNNLTRFASGKLGQSLSWQSLETDNSIDHFLEAPILYFNGRQSPKFTEMDKNLLKEYVGNGGFIFAEACCGTETFRVGFEGLMKELYPKQRLEVVPDGHPVFNVPFKIRPVPKLFSVTFGCRDYILYSPKDFAGYWERSLNDRQALELGTNIIAYATGYEKVKYKLSPVDKIARTKKTDKLLRGAVTIALVKIEGSGAETSPALDTLLALLSERADVTVADRRALVSLDDPDLFNYPIIYLTSKGSFALRRDELDSLRAFLERGGFLFADPICGNPRFDASFRAMIKELYPDRELELLPLNHPVFSSAYTIKKVSYKKKVLQEYADLDTPVLEGLMLGGRLAVLYSKYNFSNGLEGVNDNRSAGYVRDDAIRIAINIVTCALRE